MHVPYLCCRWDAVDLGLQCLWDAGRWKYSGQVLADADHSARLHYVCQHLIGSFSFRSAMFRCVCAPPALPALCVPPPPRRRLYTGLSACTAHTPSCTVSQSVTVALVRFVAAKLPLRSRAAPCSGVCSTAKGPRVGGFSGAQGRTPSSTHVPDHRPSAHVEV